MDKCREAFEQIPEIKDSLSENIVFVGNKYTTANDGFYDLVNWLNGGWYTWQSRQAEVDQLKEAMERQGKLAIQAMHEAHKGSRLELSIAKDIQASLKPELIESERQMNAQLSDENMKLEAEVDALKNLLEKDEHAHNLYYENANLQTLVEEKDKRIESALTIVSKMAKATNSTAMWAYDLEKALRGEHE